MGWLAIDTRINGSSAISWVEGEKVEMIRVEGKAARALPVLARLVKDRIDELEGVLVASGPGTFSSIRTGVLYANLVSRLKQVPLLELAESEAVPNTYSEIIKDYQSGRRSGASYVAPIYDREPNITVPRVPNPS